MSKGQFSVTVAGIDALLRGIGVHAGELASELSPIGRKRVLAALAVLYLRP
jgi:hypothetical protein